MLIFAALLAIGIGVRGAAPLARRIERIRAGTTQLANGQFESELPVESRDEIALLAEDFNRMARSLEVAAARERDLEQARRDLIAAVARPAHAASQPCWPWLKQWPTASSIRGPKLGSLVESSAGRGHDTGEGIAPGDLPRLRALVPG